MNYKLIVCFFLLSFSACRAPKYSVLFRIEKDGKTDNQWFLQTVGDAEKNYTIRKFDFLQIDLYTNKGEKILQLDSMYGAGTNTSFGFNPQMGAMNPQMGQMGQNSQFMNLAATVNVNSPNVKGYLVNDDGNIYLPLIKPISVEGLKIWQANDLVAKAYEEFYVQPYAKVNLLNRRVVIMGALGDRILPLTQENMNLLEVLVMAGVNLGVNSRNDRIRVIRNVLTDPKIQIVDLTKWETTKLANMRIEPNDVIYIEPRRRLGQDADLNNVTTNVMNTISSITSIIATVVSMTLLFKAVK